MHQNYNTHKMRGPMVSYRRDSDIVLAARKTASIFNLNKENKLFLDKFVELLRKEGIETVIEYSQKWTWISDATCDPALRTIVIPEKLFQKALKGDPKALFIFFHELGHLLLGHKPMLHHSNEDDLCKEVDSEHQADMFAFEILQLIGIQLEENQYSLFK